MSKRETNRADEQRIRKSPRLRQRYKENYDAIKRELQADPGVVGNNRGLCKRAHQRAVAATILEDALLGSVDGEDVRNR